MKLSLASNAVPITWVVAKASPSVTVVVVVVKEMQQD